MRVVRFLAGTGTKPHQRDLVSELTHLLRKVQAGDVGTRETVQRLWLKAKLMLQAAMDA
jgi:hypothetical protein